MELIAIIIIHCWNGVACNNLNLWGLTNCSAPETTIRKKEPLYNSFHLANRRSGVTPFVTAISHYSNRRILKRYTSKRVSPVLL